MNAIWKQLDIDELKLLPLRKKKGIVGKCISLGIPYHYSKRSCEVRDE